MNLNPFSSRLLFSSIVAIAFLYWIKVDASWTVFGVVAMVVLLHGMCANQTAQTQVKDASIFITGAGSGLGRALAMEAVKKGARVLHICGRRRAPLQETAQLCQDAAASSVTVHVHVLDVTKPEAVQKLANVIVNKYGCPDVLVNNAGMGSWCHVEDTTMPDAIAMTACPYLGAVFCTRAFVPAIIARGTGHVLNITSTASILPMRCCVTYQTARAAMRGYSLSLAEDLREFPNIGVTLLNSSEVTGTDYFSTNKMANPWFSQLPVMAAANYDTQTTARKTWQGVEAGVVELILPEAHWPFVWLLTLLPDFVLRLARLGSVGWRAAEQEASAAAAANDKKAN